VLLVEDTPQLPGERKHAPVVVLRRAGIESLQDFPGVSVHGSPVSWPPVPLSRNRRLDLVRACLAACGLVFLGGVEMEAAEELKRPHERQPIERDRRPIDLVVVVAISQAISLSSILSIDA
jgi:hypothetical protein